MSHIFLKIAEIIKEKKKAAICTIVSTRGSTPLKSGAKMLVYENGEIFGTIGGGRLEKQVVDDAILIIKKQKPELFRHDLYPQHEMCCGGILDIYIEPVMHKKNLIIFGGGHVGKAVAKFAMETGFDVSVVDNRENIINDWELNCYSKHCTSFTDIISEIQFDTDTFIVIATYEHSTDREILAACIKKPHAYLGMIGSKNKIEVTRKMFLASGLATDEELDLVDMPVGLEISAETAEEIAISIVAKLIKEKNKK